MEDPTRASRYQDERKPAARLPEPRRTAQLQRIEGTAREVRRAQQNHLRTDQKYDGADKNPTVASQEAPQIAIQMQDGGAFLPPGFS
jgi:hypothetical protein